MANYRTFSLRDAISHVENSSSSGGMDGGKVEFSSMFCLKALGAFFVVCIHCFDYWQVFPIIRTAVPFFFMISGFFLCKENPNDSLNSCIRSLKKVFWITLYASLFYYISYGIPENNYPLFSLKSFLKIFIIGNFLADHLWYLNSYLEALLVVIICIRYRLLRYLWMCIPFFTLWGLMTGKYEFAFPYLPDALALSRNFLTVGISCFGIGWLLRKYSRRVLEWYKHPVLYTVLLLILSEVEAILLKYSGHLSLGGDYLISTFPLAASMLLIGIKYPMAGKDSIMERVGKQYSLYIYIFHYFILRTVLGMTDMFSVLPGIIALPFIVFLLTILFIAVWKKCSRMFFS